MSFPWFCWITHSHYLLGSLWLLSSESLSTFTIRKLIHHFLSLSHQLGDVDINLFSILKVGLWLLIFFDVIELSWSFHCFGCFQHWVEYLGLQSVLRQCGFYIKLVPLLIGRYKKITLCLYLVVFLIYHLFFWSFRQSAWNFRSGIFYYMNYYSVPIYMYPNCKLLLYDIWEVDRTIIYLHVC